MNVLGLGDADEEALAFPRDVLDGVSSALILFASGRGGAADGRWFAEVGIREVMLVDHDSATLAPMLKHAPRGWFAVCDDAFSFAETTRGSWDHISADPASQLAPRIIESLPSWLALATRSATVTVYRHCFAGEPGLDAPELEPPDGWRFTRLIRRGDFRGGIYWLVGERI